MNKKKKPVVERVFTSAPVKYAPPPPQKTNNTKQYETPPNVFVPPPIVENRPFPALQGIAYQDALKMADGTKHQPQYLFPQYAPKNNGNQEVAKKWYRSAGDEKWEDSTLADWDPNDNRIFVGDLGNEVNDEALVKVFMKYPSFQRAKVIRDKHSGKSRGFGFVSFADIADFAKAIKEVNGKYIGNRPCKLKKSAWKDRLDDEREQNYAAKVQAAVQRQQSKKYHH